MSTVTDQVKEKLRAVFVFDQNMLILAAILGFFAGFASTFFRWMIEFFESIFSIKGLSLSWHSSSVLSIFITINANAGLDVLLD